MMRYTPPHLRRNTRPVLRPLSTVATVLSIALWMLIVLAPCWQGGLLK